MLIVRRKNHLFFYCNIHYNNKLFKYGRTLLVLFISSYLDLIFLEGFTYFCFLGLHFQQLRLLCSITFRSFYKDLSFIRIRICSYLFLTFYSYIFIVFRYSFISQRHPDYQIDPLKHFSMLFFYTCLLTFNIYSFGYESASCYDFNLLLKDCV